MDIETVEKAGGLVFKRDGLLKEIRTQERNKSEPAHGFFFISHGMAFAERKLLALRPTEELCDHIIKALKIELASVEGQLRDLGVKF